MYERMNDMKLQNDIDKAERNNYKCPFRDRPCDGLCNNCPQNIKHHDYNYSRIVPASNHWNDDNDYEGAILARQEMSELF